MAGIYRNIGVLGFVLSVGIACTQLFGGEQNTLAPREPGTIPTMARGPLEPGASGPAAICETGQMRCDGAQLQTCADDRGSWVTVQRCGAAALCQANPAMCLAATCSAEEMTCSGAILQKCNADRTGWDLFATCLSPAHCNSDLRQCSPEPCNPGDRRCDRSESDLSPVLEVCRDDRSDWGPLDTCVTRELCDQTRTSGSAGGLELGADGMLQVQAPATPDTVVTCNLPACAVGEVRCDGARLEYCSEGRTGWISAEECASAALCSGSLTNVGSGGTPVCLPPACAVGQHNCTETGVLQVCSEDRTGFLDQETCIAAPFCNAVLADQGQAGCRDAPCEAGQMQCNGAQIQVCRDDRTALDDVGAPCESAALCNADDPSNAFCDPPVCRRGATSGDEFHCEGALLERCNESLTVYDTIQTCVTAALCDASQRANGCKPPVCQPGGHNCAGGFLQTCNADQTGFDNTENCGSQAQCDANAGRCADPCEPGATRCNSTTGDLELCQDRLTGWQPIADCQSLALCDAADGRCNICLDGAFSCADNQLRQCAPDGRTFSRQNIPAECALAANGGGGVRACQNNQVVVNPCPLGCTNGRCHECSGTEQQCLANGQIRRCVNGFFGAPTSCSDGNACNGVESCQNNNCVGGQAPNCNDGNACTNDTCNPASGCQFPAVANRTTCTPAAGTLEVCTNGNRQVIACGQLGCAPNSTVCNNCNQGQCAGGAQFQTCNGGLFSAVQNCPANNICQGAGNCVFNCAQLNCDDGNQCTNDSCSPQTGCQRTNNNNACGDGNVCNGNETCGNGTCNRGAAAANGTPCGNGNSCQGGQCVAPTPPPFCTPNAAVCTGTTPQRCNATGSTLTTIGACVGTTATRCQGGSVTTQTCGAGTTCNAGQCVPNAPPPPPPPPARVCDPAVGAFCQNGAVVSCRADGSGLDTITCTGAGAFFSHCEGTTIVTDQCSGANECVDRVCRSAAGCELVGNSSINRSCTNRAEFGAASSGGHCSGGTCSIEGCNTAAECTVAGAQCVTITPTPNGFPGQCVPSP